MGNAFVVSRMWWKHVVAKKRFGALSLHIACYSKPGVQVLVANMYAYVTHTTFHHYLAKAYHDSCSFRRQHRRDEDKYLLLGAVDA